ncbi:MAG: heat-inducible transcriptional repressor HrcA [candidate division FCPU426 bacterium]
MTLLNERDHILLGALIERHIATAEPVSSQELCVHYGLDWSSATVRNVLARLEAAGYLEHPYTSSGKVPTGRAYRYFVEHLLKQVPRHAGNSRLSAFEILKQVQEREDLIQVTAQVLAVTSQLLAVSWLPAQAGERLKRIQLYRLASRRVLLAVETQSDAVFRQVVDLGEQVNLDLLEHATRLINERGRGLTASELEQLSRSPWPGTDRRLATWLQRALAWAVAQLQAHRRSEVVMEGASNLIQQPEFNDLAATRRLIAMLDRREDLLRSFEAPGIEREGVRVVFGEDAAGPLSALAFITETVPLGSAGEWVCIGVIGPRRMAYQRIIPLVNTAAQALAYAQAAPSQRESDRVVR